MPQLIRYAACSLHSSVRQVVRKMPFLCTCIAACCTWANAQSSSHRQFLPPTGAAATPTLLPPVLIPAQQLTDAESKPKLEGSTPVEPRTPRADDPVPPRVPELNRPAQLPRVPQPPTTRPYEEPRLRPQPAPEFSGGFSQQHRIGTQHHSFDQPVHSVGQLPCQSSGCADFVCTKRRRIGLNMLCQLKDKIFGADTPCNCPDCQIERVHVAKQPVGFTIEHFQQAQIGRGQKSQMVFRSYDFQLNTAKLNIGGYRRATRVVPLLPTNVFPVVIESSNNSQLDDRRRIAVVQALTSAGFPIPVERVVAQRPRNRDLDGADLQILEQRRRMHSLQSNDPGLPILDPHIFDRIK